MLLCCQLFTEFNSLEILWLKGEHRWIRDCVSPRGSYDPQKGILCKKITTLVNAMMITYNLQIQNKIIYPCFQVFTEVISLTIIWVKDEYKWVHYCIISVNIYGAKGVISYIFFMTEVNALIITYQSQIQNNIKLLRCQVLTEVNSMMIIWVKYG